ncbi:hypothetical protein [Pseudomonas chlororaphis]|uniref:hypothetical protein n=2 Tax=Pseudomonas TaxID=286 RepID=UPI000F56F005|nr:hypothetical protein [Pseudomonas chlororaphis]
MLKNTRRILHSQNSKMLNKKLKMLDTLELLIFPQVSASKLDDYTHGLIEMRFKRGHCWKGSVRTQNKITTTNTRNVCGAAQRKVAGDQTFSVFYAKDIILTRERLCPMYLGGEVNDHAANPKNFIPLSALLHLALRHGTASSCLTDALRSSVGGGLLPMAA